MRKTLILACALAGISTASFAYDTVGGVGPSMGDNSSLGSTTLGANTTGGRDGNLHFIGPQDRQIQAEKVAMVRHHYRHHNRIRTIR